MKRNFGYVVIGLVGAAIIAVLVSPFQPAHATTISGTILTAQGLPASCKLRLTLTNYGSNTPRLASGGAVVTTDPIPITLASDGTFSGTVTGNDQIIPAGTLYNVTCVGAGAQNFGAYSIAGSSWNFNTASPVGAISNRAFPQAYVSISNGGNPLQQRLWVDFGGGGMSCSDNPTLARTDCTVPTGVSPGQCANSTSNGLVCTVAQAFSGNKTFLGDVITNTVSTVTGTNAFGGDVSVAGNLITTSAPPTLSTDPCTTGTITWDSGFIYVCINTNTWKKAAISSW